MRIESFGQGYLNLSVSWSFVFQNALAHPANAPEMFGFAEILSDWLTRSFNIETIPLLPSR